MAPPAEGRWVEVSPSQFTHETEGLELVRDLLPDQSPFRAWSNFEFRDGRGRWHEVDLLVLGRRRLHLVELKYYSGRLRGDDHTWLRDGHRAEDSPLKLARRKAQYFASKLQDEFRLWVGEQRMKSTPPSVREVVPFVQESVFLHHPRLQCELRPGSELGLYGIDGLQATSNLPGISELLLEPADPRQTMHERVLVQLMARIGLVQRREREAGSWVIQDQPIDEGEGWQEWMASHRVSHRQRGRIRFQVLPPGASESERRRTTTIADHEFRMMGRLNHEAILKPTDLVDAELGVGLVYPFEDDWQRLDLWLADHDGPLPIETQLSLIRQVGEALQYAHGNRVVHRGLTPRAVWVRPSPSGRGVKVQVRDWQAAGGLTSDRGSAETGVTALFDASLLSRGAESWLDGFAAPEGAMASGVDRVRVDVFALGALAFYLSAGAAGCHVGVGLADPASGAVGARPSARSCPRSPASLRSAVLNATRPAVSDRTADVATFLAQLSEEERRETEVEPEVDPLEATPGAVLDGRFRLVRRLGAGSTAVGLLVSDETDQTAPERVLKVAIDDAAGRRLADEAEVLASLSSPRLVRMLEGPLTVGGRQALLLESAGDQTLAQAMSGRARVSLDLLERWGTDLLEALVALDAKGVDHRDIKPANLGVRENRGDRSKHLVLFDFSLSRAAAAAVLAGTPPYLDPFLGGRDRDRYDSAAERYAAAVVLFEMATGRPPTYGDGVSHPAAINDEADVSAERFDPTVASPMVEFFRCALAREATHRHDTAAEMLTAWQQAFHQTNTEAPEDAAERQAAADASTRLVEAGLSARALSALEPLAVLTVGDLVAVDPVRLSRLPGVAEATRIEVRRAATGWRTRLGSAVLPERRGALRQTQLPDPTDAAETLLRVAQARRGRNRAAYVSQVLGITGRIDAFATQAQIGAHLPDPVTPARAGQLGAELQDAWAADEASRTVLVGLGDQVERRLDELGGVATVDELASVPVQPDDAAGQ